MELAGLPSTIMPPPVVTLTFDLLTSRSNQQVYEPIHLWSKLGDIPFIGF